MGLNCCKPKRLIYTNINGKSTNTEKSVTKEIIKFNDPSLKIFKNEILEKVKIIVHDILGNNKMSSRTVETLQVSYLNDEETFPDINYDDFIFADEGMTQTELEEILSSCSPSSGFDEDQNSPESSNTEKRLCEGHHIELCKSPERFPELKMMMEDATRQHIVEDYIDKEDSYGNTAVSVALLESNGDALIYLVKKCYARIPLFINVLGQVQLFLIYLAQNNQMKLKEENQRQFILHVIMKEFASGAYNEEYLRDYFTTIDPLYNVSLLHFLVELCLTGQSPTNDTLECIHIIINLWPDSIDIQCQLDRHNDYRIDVIGRILVLVNVYNVDIAVDLIKQILNVRPHTISNEHHTYRRIIAAFESVPVIHNKLQNLFPISESKPDIIYNGRGL